MNELIVTADFNEFKANFRWYAIYGRPFN